MQLNNVEMKRDSIDSSDDKDISLPSDDGSNEEMNDSRNIWPRSGLQVQI